MAGNKKTGFLASLGKKIGYVCATVASGLKKLTGNKKKSHTNNKRRKEYVEPTGAKKVLYAIFGGIGKILVSVLAVFIISGCIIGCVMTAVILGMVDDAADIDLNSLELNYTTLIYTKDPDTGEYVEDTKLYGENGKLIWCSYEDMPSYLIDAAVAAEDKRFWNHQGVDFTRTLSATLSFLTGGDKGGGSTITQQLIKNVTGEDQVRIDRKVKEIFNALALEKKYSKQQILESYLNVITFGYNTYGIRAAANMYFNKDVSELTLEECVALVSITNWPTRYELFGHMENNKERRAYVYSQMLELGYINKTEYDRLCQSDVITSKGQPSPSVSTSKYQSWFIDYVIEDVIHGFMDEYDWDYETAEHELYNGGYRVYATVDNYIQNEIETYYKNPDNFPQMYNASQPDSAFVVLNYNGEIVGIVGGKGEKSGSRLFNIASSGKRHIGSTIKPISSYALALEDDLITYSTVITDEPVYKAGEVVGETEFKADWPINYYAGYLGNVTVEYAVQRSVNTIPVKLVTLLTPEKVFSFMQNKLHITSLVSSGLNNDVAVAPMALGSLTVGISPLELAGAYQMIGNGGLYIEPHSYTKVLNSRGEVALKANAAPERVISPETATILNKLCRQVVVGKNGTGTAANIPGYNIVGKTGSSSENTDLWFAGLSPEYVGIVWLGYSDALQRIKYQTYPTPIIWKSVMEKVIKKTDPAKDFPSSSNVITCTYCQKSGDLATASCTSTATGWYKTTNIPGYCTVCGGGGYSGYESGYVNPYSSSSSQGRVRNKKDDGVIKIGY